MEIKVQNKSHILLGSNYGNRESELKMAQKMIVEDVGTILNESSIYETAAWGLLNQQAFLNQVLLVETPLNPQDLLDKVLAIETKMGRVRKQKWGERLIDIDILYYNNAIVEEPNLSIPHPFIHERKFTLIPLCEMSPNYIHPKLSKSNQDLLSECTDDLEVAVWDKSDNSFESSNVSSTFDVSDVWNESRT